MIKVAIIDDEQNAREAIAGIIRVFAPKDITIVGQGEDIRTGIDIIKKQKPEIVLLDIRMPDGTGFDLLKQIKNEINFKVIFVTTYEQYAITAFKFHAFDYILKPVSPDELVGAIKNAASTLHDINTSLKLNTYLENANSPGKKKKIVLKTLKNVIVINTDEIIRLESDVNYTYVFLNDGKKILVSTTLKEYEELLNDSGFFRIHKTHLINLSQIAQFNKLEENLIQMKDNTLLPVSRRKKATLLSMLKNL